MSSPEFLKSVFHFRPKAVLKNFILLQCSVAFVFAMYSGIDGYRWLFETLVSANSEFMYRYPHLTDQEKLEFKLGYNYKFVSFVKQHTPETAIIGMPGKGVFFPPGYRSKFKDNILAKGWISYFLYPRKIVYDEEKKSNPLYRDITHVVFLVFPEDRSDPENIFDKVEINVLTVKK